MVYTDFADLLCPFSNRTSFSGEIHTHTMSCCSYAFQSNLENVMQIALNLQLIWYFISPCGTQNGYLLCRLYIYKKAYVTGQGDHSCMNLAIIWSVQVLRLIAISYINPGLPPLHHFFQNISLYQMASYRAMSWWGTEFPPKNSLHLYYTCKQLSKLTRTV